jgi:hypothetical protein
VKCPLETARTELDTMAGRLAHGDLFSERPGAGDEVEEVILEALRGKITFWQAGYPEPDFASGNSCRSF